MIKVLFSNLSGEPLDRKMMSVMKKVIVYTIVSEIEIDEGEVSLTLCDNAYIRELNKLHRNIDRETDVLSFPTLDFEESDGYVAFGDIVVSLEKARSQADEYGHNLLRELCFLCVHSTLHLLGYDHVDNEEGRIYMEQRQEEILNSFGILR